MVDFGVEPKFTAIEDDAKEKNLWVGIFLVVAVSYSMYAEAKMLAVGLDSITRYLSANRKIREERMFAKIKKGGEKCEEDLV